MVYALYLTQECSLPRLKATVQQLFQERHSWTLAPFDSSYREFLLHLSQKRYSYVLDSDTYFKGFVTQLIEYLLDRASETQVSVRQLAGVVQDIQMDHIPLLRQIKARLFDKLAVGSLDHLASMHDFMEYSSRFGVEKDLLGSLPTEDF